MAAFGTIEPSPLSSLSAYCCPFCDPRYGARGVEFCRSGQLAPSGAIRPRVRSGRIVTTLLLTEGNHRLGQAPQGERAELLGFDASFERRVDALAEQDFQVDAAGGGGAVGAVGVAVGSLVDPLPVPRLIAPWALPFRSRKSALRWATRRFTGRAAM